MEKLQILEVYDVGRRGEKTDESNSQVSGMNKRNDINYMAIWKRQVWRNSQTTKVAINLPNEYNKSESQKNEAGDAIWESSTQRH